jgi:hypothetical protein
MSISIREIRGMAAEVEAKLSERGIMDAEQLIAACRTAEGRRELARALGVDMAALARLEMAAFLALARQGALVRSHLPKTGD